MRKIAAVLAAVAVVIGVWLGYSGLGHDKAGRAPSSIGASAKPAPVNASDIQRFETALNGTDMQAQANVLSASIRQAFVSNGQPLLPSVVTIQFAPNTLRQQGTLASIDAVVTQANAGQATFTFKLVCPGSNGSWLIFDTVRK